MSKFLKIENPGVAPTEAFTLLGASLSRSSTNTRTIGKFGSGNKHGVAVCLRHGLAPIVYCGNQKLEFGVRKQVIQGKSFSRVFVQKKTSVEDLGFVLEYGAIDWTEIELALREFVSNALDRAEVEQQTPKPWESLVIEIVDDSKVRAKSNFTRVFIPVNDKVERFYRCLGKWFLHFSEPEALEKTVLTKANRNLDPSKRTAVIYRRGVRVREFESSEVPSIFDYNLEDLQLDESRKVDDWRVKAYATMALAGASEKELAVYLQSFCFPMTFWEHTFERCYLTTGAKEPWRKAFDSVFDSSVVVSAKESRLTELAAKKGYSVVEVPAEIEAVALEYGLRTSRQVITDDEREGREVFETIPSEVRKVLDALWELLSKLDMLNGREKPSLKGFTKIMEFGSQVLGFYANDTIYINSDLFGGSTQQLKVTVLEELVHHITGATDMSRDFQDYILNLFVKGLQV